MDAFDVNDFLKLLPLGGDFRFIFATIGICLIWVTWEHFRGPVQEISGKHCIIRRRKFGTLVTIICETSLRCSLLIIWFYLTMFVGFRLVGSLDFSAFFGGILILFWCFLTLGPSAIVSNMLHDLLYSVHGNKSDETSLMTDREINEMRRRKKTIFRQSFYNDFFKLRVIEIPIKI